MGVIKRVDVVCAECGKKENVPLSRSLRYVCCSVSCMGKYNSKRYSKQIQLVCPICGEIYYCKQSKINHHRTCGSSDCRSKWLSETRTGKNNSNYFSIENDIRSNVKEIHTNSKYIYIHTVKEVLGLNSTKDIPKGYVIHHKDANHNNNNISNLVVLPKSTHRLIHTIFGNIMINALHTGKISRDVFFSMCNDEQRKFYNEIIDLDVSHQVVVKQGELLESPEEDNQQPSIYRNIIEGSTTNERVLTHTGEDSNLDTSALPDNKIIGDDIV